MRAYISSGRGCPPPAIPPLDSRPWSYLLRAGPRGVVVPKCRACLLRDRKSPTLGSAVGPRGASRSQNDQALVPLPRCPAPGLLAQRRRARSPGAGPALLPQNAGRASSGPAPGVVAQKCRERDRAFLPFSLPP